MACKLCKNLVFSTAVAFNATTGNLVVTVPQASYNNGQRYCIVIAQSIPTTTTITAPVYIQVGTGTALYPLFRANGAQCTATSLRTRTKYATKCVTNASTGSFVLTCPVCCAPNYDIPSIDGTT